MTSVWVVEHGWVYLNAIIDCCTREIVDNSGTKSPAIQSWPIAIEPPVRITTANSGVWMQEIALSCRHAVIPTFSSA
jgi:hypothetical protein